jgi:hypothetical protein
MINHTFKPVGAGRRRPNAGRVAVVRSARLTPFGRWPRSTERSDRLGTAPTGSRLPPRLPGRYPHCPPFRT